MIDATVKAIRNQDEYTATPLTHRRVIILKPDDASLGYSKNHTRAIIKRLMAELCNTAAAPGRLLTTTLVNFAETGGGKA